MEEDLYALLELTPSCTTDEIKRQYKKLALQYHPDRHQTASDSQRTHFEKKFKEVARAYEVLSDPAARRQYDALRSNPPQQQQEDYSYPSFSHHPYTRDSRSSTRTNSSNNNGGASGWRDDDPFHPFGFEQRSTPHQTPPVAGGGGYGRHRSPFASFFDDFVFRDPFAIFNEMFQSTMHPSMASHHRRDVVDDGGVPFGFGAGMKHMMMGNHLLAADPFAMFHGGGGFGFHENDDPFPSMFSSLDKRRTQRHPFAGLLMGGDGDPFSMFGSSSSAMPGGMKMMSYSSSTMTTTMGRGAEESGVQRQTTTTTTTVGPTGQRVTKTVRTVQRPNGLVTEDVEEEVAQPPQQQQRRYAPLLPPSRAALPPPTHRSSESRDPQPQQQPQQQQQSPPPLRRAHPSSQQQRYHSLPPAASRAAPPTALPYHPHHHHQPVPSSSSPSLPISHQRLPQRATVTHY